MIEPTKINPPIHQLGLPPMELAETTTERDSSFLYNCVYPALQKMFVIIFVVTLSAGVYVLLLKFLETSDISERSREIIIITAPEAPNITLFENDLHIIFKMANTTSISKTRRKRSAMYAYKPSNHWNNEDIQKAKEIIRNHKTLCNARENSEICKELFMKLKNIVNYKDSTEKGFKEIDTEGIFKRGFKRNIDKYHDAFRSANYDYYGRKVPSPSLNTMPKVPTTPIEMERKKFGVPKKTADPCLITKLLKRSHSHGHGTFDSPSSELTKPYQSYQSHQHHPRLPNNPLTMQGREFLNHKPHPQDVDIIMSYFMPKPAEKQSKGNLTAREVPCPSGTLPCAGSEDCIDEKEWCDGSVDCADASDEVRCSCKSRVDESRLCDGYFDCPFGEDEMGCFGCNENSFSCNDINQPQSTCYSKEQRCNNQVDCPNSKDETECNMLAPSIVLKNPMFAGSRSQGVLHRNFKGNWFPVCENPYMWAHDVCRRETGLMIRPPFIEIVPVDPLLKVNYLNAGPAGTIQTSDSCFNSSTVYVTCPDLICGTRVSTSSHILRQNLEAENRLFGRNKRFLYPGFQRYLYDPYNNMMYYGSRMKRDTQAIDTKYSNRENSAENTDARNKRAESRVVGGKASQPADWPWMVAIYRDGMFHCGGVIFNQNWVISAAHCVAKFWDYYYEVQVGMLRRFSFSPQEQNHRVTHILVNQHYNQIDMKDDLSLLKVEPEIQFSRWVRPICLPGPNTAGSDWLWGPAPETLCTAVGWGATVEHGPDPDHLREVEVPIWKNCKHREDKAGHEICAGLVEGGKDACQGDSGGPLLCRNPLNTQQWYLAGIVSHGDGCARENEPGVYTRVSLFVKWIKYETSSNIMPMVKPLQDCPGFKCISGITKCLPLSRKCDRIVDCLNAEDEMGCDFTNMRSVNNDVELIINSTDNNSFSEKQESILSTESSMSELYVTLPKATTNIDTSGDISTITEITNTMLTEKTFEIETSKFVEFSSYNTTESSLTTDAHIDSILTEVTLSDIEPDNITTNNVLEFTTVTIDKEKIDSRSSILEKPDQHRRSDIISDDEVNTVLSTQKDTFDSSTEISLKIEQTDSTITSPITEGQINFDYVASDSDFDYVDNNTERVIIDLSPNVTISNIFEASTDTNSNKQDQEFSESKIDEVSAKDFPETGQPNNISDEASTFISQLQPANIRRKHLVPKEFLCKRIFQKISYNQRCDHRADCEDGTDELDCTCTDYLATYDENLLCDGVFDCSDGQDEVNCYSCPDNNFLCKKSGMCLPMQYVCDGKTQCPLGEDELNCYALSNGREMFFDIEDKPKINLEGYITKRNRNDWQVICEDELSVEQLEDYSMHICRYLGFSSANRYTIKYINVKEEDLISSSLEDRRTRRNSKARNQISFAYRTGNESNSQEAESAARNIIIKEPQPLKEECVPNVTKTCKSLYVFCDRSLYTNFDITQNMILNREVEESHDVTTHMWPWVAKVYVEGAYKCTGILLDESWVLISSACLWDFTISKDYITVLLGSHRTLHSVGHFEKIHEVDAKKELYNTKVALLHLTVPVKPSNNVKPMVLSSFIAHNVADKTCVAIGENIKNETISVFLNETTNNCKLGNRCFMRNGNETICKQGSHTHRQWSGIISCHGEQGWYPTASFVDSRGECYFGQSIIATDIEHLKQDLKYYTGKTLLSDRLNGTENINCEGIRCGRGKCIHYKEVCDGVTHCEDGKDEFDESCKMKRELCGLDPYRNGCECSLDHMKCKNGKCIYKELFNDGKDDCGDGTDEPTQTSCSNYITRVMPSRHCDGIVHCQDKSDEDPAFCKCFAKRTFKCGTKLNDENYCVSPDMVCDGSKDCPDGTDERNCIGLAAPDGTSYGMGQVIIQSHGVWRTKCYQTANHTKSELEAICWELGFLSGHAKEIKDMKDFHINTPNNLVLEPFSEVVLNNRTVINMRNSDQPLARAVFDENLKDCYPVFIECM